MIVTTDLLLSTRMANMPWAPTTSTTPSRSWVVRGNMDSKPVIVQLSKVLALILTSGAGVYDRAADEIFSRFHICCASRSWR